MTHTRHTDPRLDLIEQRMLWMAEMLHVWLSENHDGDNRVSLFFLCGIVVSLIQEEWPDMDRPKLYTDLLRAMEAFASELGPAVMSVELQALAQQQPRRKRSSKKQIETVN